jgi:HD superfamily phosphodiesterase
MEDKINKLIEKIKSHFENDFSGHDWDHILRVLNNAKFIQSKEGGNQEIVIVGVGAKGASLLWSLSVCLSKPS